MGWKNAFMLVLPGVMVERKCHRQGGSIGGGGKDLCGA